MYIKRGDRLLNQELVYRISSFIPVGKMSTYQNLARLAGVKNPRLVGNILHRNKDPKKIPCHRVVHSDGTLAQNYAFGGNKAQKEKLLKEKVEFINEKVNLKQCLWQPSGFLVLFLKLYKIAQIIL